MNWKKRILKLVRLKGQGVTFSPHLYDFIHISQRGIGLITNIHNRDIFSVAFIADLKNPDFEPFFDVVKFRPAFDNIIPSYESLVSYAQELKYSSNTNGTNFYEKLLNSIVKLVEDAR